MTVSFHVAPTSGTTPSQIPNLPRSSVFAKFAGSVSIQELNLVKTPFFGYYVGAPCLAPRRHFSKS
jgi:hypothetical protein